VCVHAVQSQPGASQEVYLDLLVEKLNCGKSTARRMFQKCLGSGWLVERGDPRFRRYSVTDHGSAEASRHPSPIDWRQ
jgi:hypothetical protein